MPVYQVQSNSGNWEVDAPDESAAAKHAQMIDNFNEKARYYMGPHLYDAVTSAVNGVGGLLYLLSPAGDISDMVQSSQDLTDSTKEGRWVDSLKNALYMGAATAGIVLPGNVGMVRKGAEESETILKKISNSGKKSKWFTADIPSMSETGYQNARKIAVVKNPTPKDFNDMVRQSEYGLVRAMDDASGNTYIWDASKALHVEMAASNASDNMIHAGPITGENLKFSDAKKFFNRFSENYINNKSITKNIAPPEKTGKSIEDVLSEIRRAIDESNSPNALASGELPMDEASRMARAREMGFNPDETWYHGTRAGDINEFNPNITNTPGEGVLNEKGVFFTGDPEFAGEFAGGWQTPEAFHKEARKEGGYTIYPSIVRKGKQKVIENFGFPENSAVANAIETARKEGYNSLLLKGVDESGQYQDMEQLIMLDPKDIRSKFAKFDPAKSNSANILAGAGAAAIVAPAAYNDLSDSQSQEE